MRGEGKERETYPPSAGSLLKSHVSQGGGSTEARKLEPETLSGLPCGC